MSESQKNHFTYAEPIGENLQQGDLLSKSPDLVSLLSDVHPHYLQEDYTHFLVITQSCDLVMREGKDGRKSCKSRYITLAGVRPLSLAVERELEKYQGDFEKKAKVCNSNVKNLLTQFLVRLFNNNESDYFYLHSDADLNLFDNSCAFLRLTIPLRAYEHYDLCKSSRILSLTDNFQAKLGWLVGNMYSRVGTVDWVPDNATEDEFKDIIDEALKKISCKWIEEKQLKKAKNDFIDYHSYSLDDLRLKISNIKVPNKKEQLINQILLVLKELEIIDDPSKEQSFEFSLRNDPRLVSLMPK